MAEWRGCGCGGDRCDAHPGCVSELALHRRRARRAGPLLRRAALGGRDARDAPVRERRRAAGGGAPTRRRPAGGGRPGGGAAVPLAGRPGVGGPDPATPRSATNGRVATLPPGARKSPAGMYRLRFDTGAYFAALGVAPFHPFVEIVFEIRDAEQYHVPLLVSPFGYTTYRGS